MEKITGIGLILCIAIILASNVVALLIPEPARVVEVTIWLPEDVSILQGIASEVHLSGTAATIPFETYQNLSKNLQDQKVIIARGARNIITVNYLGKVYESYSYHTTQQYYSSFDIALETICIEGNTLRYSIDGRWFVHLMIVFFGIIAGLVVLIISMNISRKKTAKNS